MEPVRREDVWDIHQSHNSARKMHFVQSSSRTEDSRNRLNALLFRDAGVGALSPMVRTQQSLNYLLNTQPEALAPIAAQLENTAARARMMSNLVRGRDQTLSFRNTTVPSNQEMPSWLLNPHVDDIDSLLQLQQRAARLSASHGLQQQHQQHSSGRIQCRSPLATDTPINDFHVELPSSPPRFREDRTMTNNIMFLASNEHLPNHANGTPYSSAHPPRLRMHSLHPRQRMITPPISNLGKEKHTNVPGFVNKRNRSHQKKEMELDAANVLCSLARMDPRSSDQPNSPTSTLAIVSDVSEGMSGTNSISMLESFTDDLTCSPKPPIYTFPSYPNRLSMPGDIEELNSLHCFVREELLELFVIPKEQDSLLTFASNLHEKKDDTDGSPSTCTTSDDNKPKMCTPVSSATNEESPSQKRRKNLSGRVGFRCVHCSRMQARPRHIVTGRNSQSKILDPDFVLNDCANATMGTFYPRSLSELYRLVCTWQRVHFQKCRHIPPSVRKLYRELKTTDRSHGKTKYWVTSAMQLGLVNDDWGRGCVRFNHDISE